jgi:hypothetical protein
MLDLIDSVSLECQGLSKKLGKNVRAIPSIIVQKFLSDSIYTYLPHFIAKWIVSTSIKNIDMSISNVAGPRESLIYNGVKMTDLICMTTPGFFTTFIGIISYDGGFTMTLCVDKALGIDEKEFWGFIRNEMLELKEKCEKGTILQHQTKESKKYY